MSSESRPQASAPSSAPEHGAEDDLFSFDGLLDENALEDPLAPAVAPELTDGASAQDGAQLSGETRSERGRSFPASFRFPRVWLIAAAFVMLNLAGLGVVLRSQREVTTLARDLGQQFESASEKLAASASAARTPTPTVAIRSEGEECLDAAAHAIERGEFEAARRSLYALLAVADRLEASARVDFEARASFLIGDSYRLQADALDGGHR